MRRLLLILFALTLGGCSTLPHMGPMAGAIETGATRPNPSYALVDLDYAATQKIAALPPQALERLAGAGSDAPNDLIEPGDSLSIAIFESGVEALFAHQAAQASSSSSLTSPQTASSGGSQEVLPEVVVDRGGDVMIPFARHSPGLPEHMLHLAGLSPPDAAEVVRRSLEGIAVDPQVMLNVSSTEHNAVGVLGAVKSPGIYTLKPDHDRLLDMLEAAGGTSQTPNDLQPYDALVTVDRVLSDGEQRHAEAVLSNIIADPAENIRLAPRDQVHVLERPRKYIIFGAVNGRGDQVPITDQNVTLAAALSRSSGLDPSTADAEAVMVFRFERPEVAAALRVTVQAAAKGVPIVYRLNMRDPQGLFVANNFDMRADDLIYVPVSRLSEAKAFLDFVNEISTINYDTAVQSNAWK